MARRKRREEEENLDRWLISYADFITLLFAFFVVMYAISSVNEGKYRVLSDTLVSAFKTTPKTMQPIQVGDDGVTGEPSPLKSEKTATAAAPGVIDQLSQIAQLDELGIIAMDFERAMADLVEQDLIKVTHNELWVEIEINTSILFDSGSAHLEEEARPVLYELARILNKYPNFIQVEGFTDNVPIATASFPSNWELSAHRAASVVHLFMGQGVQPERMAAIGYGEYRPITENATTEGRRRNRRVVLVILADDKARRTLDIQRNAVAGGK
ncbi:MAG: flagellar motor protein MotD [Thiohalomonadaceae bacterium]